MTDHSFRFKKYARRLLEGALVSVVVVAGLVWLGLHPPAVEAVPATPQAAAPVAAPPVPAPAPENCAAAFTANGRDINAKDEEGNTALIYTIKTQSASDIACLESLIDAGVRLNEFNNEGDTALLAAVKKSDAVAVDVLIAAYANLNYRDAAGKSAIALAEELRGQSKEAEAVWQSLVRAGAK